MSLIAMYISPGTHSMNRYILRVSKYTYSLNRYILPYYLAFGVTEPGNETPTAPGVSFPPTNDIGITARQITITLSQLLTDKGNQL